MKRVNGSSLMNFSYIHLYCSSGMSEAVGVRYRGDCQMKDSELNIYFKGIRSWGRHVSLIWNSNGNDLLCFQQT
jgi:hypothetical protein